AIAFNPNSVIARLGLWEYLMDFGRIEEARRELGRARDLDPLSVRISFDSAAESFADRDLDRALRQLEKTIAMDPHNAIAYDLMGTVYYEKAMPAEGFAAHEKANSFRGEFSQQEIADIRLAYESAGSPGYLRKENELRRKRRAEGKYQSALFIAMNYAQAGDDKEGLDWLEKAVEERTP